MEHQVTQGSAATRGESSANADSTYTAPPSLGLFGSSTEISAQRLVTLFSTYPGLEQEVFETSSRRIYCENLRISFELEEA